MTKNHRNASARTWGYLLVIGMLFVLGTTISLLHDIRQSRKERFSLAASQADILSQTIFAARRWTMGNGSVSLPKDVDRVGVNHATMAQFIGEVLGPEGFHIHIVSRNAPHPEDLPDSDWERAALGKIVQGSGTEYSLTGPAGNQVFRSMEPMTEEAECDRCHAQQGHKVGEVRGAVSIAFPYAPFERSEQHAEGREIIAHLLSLGMALGFLFFLGRRIVGLIRSLAESQRKVSTLEEILPMCANCKKIRKDGAETSDPKSWVSVESYIVDHSDAKVSHGICPECVEKLYRSGENLTGK